MRKAERFQSGETLARDIGPKLNLLVDRSNREIRGDGRSIAVNECGNTITISQLGPKGAGGGGGASVFMVKITGLHPDFTTLHSDYETVFKKPWFTGNVYANGYGGLGDQLISPTVEDAIIRLPRLADGEYNLTNMWCMAVKVSQIYFDYDDTSPILDGGGATQTVDVYWATPTLL